MSSKTWLTIRFCVTMFDKNNDIAPAAEGKVSFGMKARPRIYDEKDSIKRLSEDFFNEIKILHEDGRLATLLKIATEDLITDLRHKDEVD